MNNFSAVDPERIIEELKRLLDHLQAEKKRMAISNEKKLPNTS